MNVPTLRACTCCCHVVALLRLATGAGEVLLIRWLPAGDCRPGTQAGGRSVAPGPWRSRPLPSLLQSPCEPGARSPSPPGSSQTGCESPAAPSPWTALPGAELGDTGHLSLLTPSLLEFCPSELRTDPASETLSLSQAQQLVGVS